MKFVRKMFKNEEGATAIEYGLIAALIAVAAIVAMGQLGNTLSNTFKQLDEEIRSDRDTFIRTAALRLPSFFYLKQSISNDLNFLAHLQVVGRS